ncbi:collagen binding domain-containing protein [Levilactobacillus tujiorum]|uniref:LPXTG cell wall anchor domain-containing protein n=1 Tax=Levilactobacillus tujiorum TaxID=2912243 RepID=A0ABX1L4K0_9LACO|nr:collagen binding domain-containing protein [Levilactobacillus tujiorum]MCH5464961.1 Ig-like domain-containing protein [Levilactobacillus tujiorum]NLR12001.1 LPXTG cell wall anchor domain-containing protein [Lactobacillus sp. HBUAS51387]NLR29951.1 LPXTG cell wall anchor domain-containing protein [Levilactobacillus tujiorum]
MKLNSKVWRLLVGLFSLVFLLVVSQTGTPAQAATNYNGADFTTSASVTNGPDFKHADTIDIEYNLNFGSTPIHNGDTITLNFPENLKGKTPGDTFKVYDQDGTVIGEAVVSDKGVVITMNDALEGKTNDKLTLNLMTKYRYEDTGEKDVIFPLENGGNSTSQINIVANEANLSKKGTLQEDGTIKWTILVDRREIEMKNLDIKDTIGANQEMIHGMTVSNGHWENTTTFQREKPAMTEGKDYNVTYNNDGFDLSFNDTVNNLVVVDYYTKVTDPSLIDSGYKFRNNALMTWGGGTSGTKNSEEANGKVSSSKGNSGSGSGDTNETEEPGIDTDEDTGTGTTDTDGGTETDEEEAAREEEEAKEEAAKEAAKKPATKPAKAKSSAAKSKTAKHTVAPVTATENPGATTKTNTKLPQTSDHQSLTGIIGGTLVLATLGLGAVIRRHF